MRQVIPPTHETAGPRPRPRSPAGWALLGLAAGVGSCLVSDPPVYEGTAQTPPVMFLLDAAPQVTTLLGVSTGDRIDLNVPFRSQDDAGDELIARLYLDYALDTEEVLAPLAFISPGKFTDDRSVALRWQVPPQLSGCRQLALVLTHRSNLNEANRPSSNRDTAVAIWFVDINNTSGTPPTDCPVVGQ